MHSSRRVKLIASLVSLAVVLPPVVAAQAVHVVTVRATDYKFDAPVSVPSGTVSFRLQNAGKEVHHLWLVQLRDSKTYKDFETAMNSAGTARMPSWAVDVGGPNEASPGVDAFATITLEPGKYALVCYVPSPDGRPHVMKGMMRPFEVTKLTTTAKEPKADVTIRLTDYAFDLNKPIQSGPQVIRIENSAPQSHEVVIGRLLPNKTMRDAMDWLNNGQRGAAPVIAIGGASGLANGRHQIITATFEPGRYVLLCFIPDIKDGKPHTDHGMAKEITVAAPR